MDSMSTEKTGGMVTGVCWLLSGPTTSVNPDNENDIESIFVKISLHNNKSLIVESMYRPPNSDLAYMEDL